MKKFLVLLSFIPCLAQADFATGMVVGMLLPENHEISNPNFPVATELNKHSMAANEVAIINQNSALESDLNKVKKLILIASSKGKFKVCYSTGLFDVDANNYLKLQETSKPHKAFIHYFESRGYKVTTLPSGKNNGLCFSWK